MAQEIKGTGPLCFIKQMQYFHNNIAAYLYTQIQPGIYRESSQSYITMPYRNNISVQYQHLNKNRKFVEYPLKQLPVRPRDLSSYALVLYFHRDHRVVRRFYRVFKIQMPTTGAWDLLMFCAAFNLDLSEWVGGVA